MSHTAQCSLTSKENDGYVCDHCQKDVNLCDKCGLICHSESGELIWIDTEDFEPLEGEKLKPEAYKKYSALCESCYSEELV